jgi:hypothetical protein
MPGCGKVWVLLQLLELAGKVWTVPSSQSMVQRWRSNPGSLNGAVRLTWVPARNACHGVGAVSCSLDGTLATVTVTLSLTGGLTPSLAVMVAM